MANVKERIVPIITEIIELELGHDDLFSNAGVDSLMALDILTELEREFECKIPEESLREFTTINSIVALMETVTTA